MIHAHTTPGSAATPPPRIGARHHIVTPWGVVPVIDPPAAPTPDPPVPSIRERAAQMAAAAQDAARAAARRVPPWVVSENVTFRAGWPAELDLELRLTERYIQADSRAGSPAWVEEQLAGRGPGWVVTRMDHLRGLNDLRIRVSARYAPHAATLRQMEMSPEYTPPARRDQVAVIQVTEEVLRGLHNADELIQYLQNQARAAFGPDYTPVEITEVPEDYPTFGRRRFRVRGRYTGPAPEVRQQIRGDVLYDPGVPGEFSIFGGRGYGYVERQLARQDATFAFDAAYAQGLAERRQQMQQERAAREAANARAKALLESLLTPDQRAQWAAEQRFELTGTLGRRYRVEVGTQGNVWELDPQGRPVVQWCAAPESRSGVPIFDSMAAQLLHLRHDEAGFRAVANRLRVQTYLPDGTPVVTHDEYPW